MGTTNVLTPVQDALTFLENTQVMPLIWGAAALGTAVYGLCKGAEGTKDILSANDRSEWAQYKYQDAWACLEMDRDKTKEIVEKYNKLRLQIASTTIRRYVDFIEVNQRKTTQNEQKFLKDFNISPQQLSQYRAVAINSENALGSIVMASTGPNTAYNKTRELAAAMIITTLAGLLSAVAMRSGALSVSKGSMAVSSLVLGGLTLGPALTIGGFVLARQGKKSLERVQQYETNVKTAIQKIKGLHDLLRQVRTHLYKLEKLLHVLNRRSQSLLKTLESRPFNPQQDAVLHQQVTVMVKALVDIIETPIFDANGELNLVIRKVLNQYSAAFDTKQILSRGTGMSTISNGVKADLASN